MTINIKISEFFFTKILRFRSNCLGTMVHHAELEIDKNNYKMSKLVKRAIHCTDE